MDQPETSRLRTVSFDAKEHAHLFRVDALRLTLSPHGNRRLVLTVEHHGALIRAGSMTHVPAGPQTLGGLQRPPRVAVHGRMAEFSDEQVAVIEAAGMRVESEQGRKKTFRTIFIDMDRIDDARGVFEGLKTSTGKACFKGGFTARALAEFARLVREQTAATLATAAP